MTRRLACSDIHGEGHRLLQVLEKAKYEPGKDRLFLLGDYIDRGTDSPKTVEIVQELQRQGAIALIGNHEDMAVAAYRMPIHQAHWFREGGKRTRMDYGDQLPWDLIRWIESLPYYHEESDCILVHAGIRPNTSNWTEYLNDILWIRDNFHRGYQGKRVIFGHTPTSWITGAPGFVEVWHGPDKTGIDTGAAYGGRLTLLDIDSGETWWA